MTFVVDESESDQHYPAVWQDNMVMVAGEITTQAKLDYEKVQMFFNLRDSSHPCTV